MKHYVITEYLIIIDGDELRGDVAGITHDLSKAQERFSDLVEQAKEWAKGDDVEEEIVESEGGLSEYRVWNFTKGTFWEIKIVAKESM